MNHLTLAVAGGRKTQSIVDDCAAAQTGRRILVLTYTLANQHELHSRLAASHPLQAKVDVLGWYSFLLRHWIRPYLPRRFEGQRLRGFNFEGDPGMYAAGQARYLDSEGRAYKRHVSKLAYEVYEASGGAPLDRLGRLYHEVRIDEAQDLNGWDLELLDAMFASSIDIHLVADPRQALILTNPRDQKNAQYKGIKIKAWFDTKVTAGVLQVQERSTTWRCSQAIADLADATFGESWGFAATTSRSEATCGHDGLFAITVEDVEAYYSAVSPLCLRHSVASWKQLELPFVTFGMAKGLGADHVLIAPTGSVTEFLTDGKKLADVSACALYVAITRARHSVAFVSESPEALGLRTWTPP